MAKLDRVLIIGDTHCPGMLKSYPAFLARAFEQWDCTRAVHIGDLVDWHAINFHGRHPETAAVTDEVYRARGQVKQLANVFKGVAVDWLIGNHDALPKRRAEDAGLPSDALVSESDYWGLPDNWKVHPRFSQLEIDGVLYSHGETGSAGKYPAINQAIANMQHTVIGHHHARFGVYWTANYSRRVFGMSVGCGVDWRQLQFEYGRKFAAKPFIGCGIVIDGKYPYTEPMEL